MSTCLITIKIQDYFPKIESIPYQNFICLFTNGESEGQIPLISKENETFQHQIKNVTNDIKYKRSFWVNVKKDVDSKNVTDPDVVNFVLDTYLNRFWIRSTEDRQDVFKWINTAAQYRRLVDSNWWKLKC